MPAIPHLVEFASRRPPSKFPFKHNPFSSTAFSLDASGFAGFFGGENAISAMATVPMVSWRRWAGWYNSPGAYEIAQKYGQLPNSQFWDRVFPGPKHSAARLFGLDGEDGPPYVSPTPGANLDSTSHTAYLVASRVADMPSVPVRCRLGSRTTVTIIDLKHDLPRGMHRIFKRSADNPFLCAFPISVSLGACLLCALFQDWFCFASIAQGIVTSGLTTAVIGIGRISFWNPSPAERSSKEYGVLVDNENRSIIVLGGEQGALNAITRGHFLLTHDDQSRWHFWIGICSVLLTLQFFAQLLLIPQGTLVGQLLFVMSLAVSWVYNTLVRDPEELQTDIFFGLVHLDIKNIRRFDFGNRTSGAVFACLALKRHGGPTAHASDDEMKQLLDQIIANDTDGWTKWKQYLVRKLSEQDMYYSSQEFSELVQDLAQHEAEVLQKRIADTTDAYEGWKIAFGPPRPDPPCPSTPS